MKKKKGKGKVKEEVKVKVKPRAKAAATKGKGKCRVPVKTSGLVDSEEDEEAMEVDAVVSEEEEPRQKQA